MYTVQYGTVWSWWLTQTTKQSLSRFRTSCSTRPIETRLITAHEHARKKIPPTAVEHEFMSGLVTALLDRVHQLYVYPTIARKYGKPLHGHSTVWNADGHIQQLGQCTMDDQRHVSAIPTTTRGQSTRTTTNATFQRETRVTASFKI